jgi:hypothetical protein
MHSNNWKIKLKCISNNWSIGLGWIHLAQDSAVTACCEYSNEPFGSTEGMEHLDQMSNCQNVNKGSVCEDNPTDKGAKEASIYE